MKSNLGFLLINPEFFLSGIEVITNPLLFLFNKVVLNVKESESALKRLLILFMLLILPKCSRLSSFASN